MLFGCVSSVSSHPVSPPLSIIELSSRPAALKFLKASCCLQRYIKVKSPGSENVQIDSKKHIYLREIRSAGSQTFFPQIQTALPKGFYAENQERRIPTFS